MFHPTKSYRFNLLVESINRCSLCTRMDGRRKVLSEKNGDINSSILFVGEAPGRIGADRTGIPFYGDAAGQNFERLLYTAGLTRREVFVTNAVLCNPRDEKGNNSSPTRREVRNCSLYLSILLDIIRPDIIVTLGHFALMALDIIESHNIELQRDVRRPIKWNEFTVLPMYHPGSRAMVHRSHVDQINDFLFLRDMLGHSR